MFQPPNRDAWDCSVDLLLVAIVIQLLGGTGAVLASKWPRLATALGAGGAALGCLVGLEPTRRVLSGAAPVALRLAWDGTHGAFLVEIDALSAFFLLPVLGLSALAAVYGGSYLFAYRDRKSLGPPWFFFNLCVAGMVMMAVARTAVLFLMAWEVMSISAYFLVTFEGEKEGVRQAGWIYLMATHLGVAFLYFAFVALGRDAGSLEFPAMSAVSSRGTGAAGMIFLCALAGFGAKAGLVPFHIWLPEAHPAAPSHVSALMSGVMIKMAVYGLLRVLTILGQPAPWWGMTLAGIGLLTALVGIALALYQRDMKRALAYSSIENMGLITLALGVGSWGKGSGIPAVAALGTAAALFHVWNHCLMKGLMFLSAGSVLHGTGTRDMEKLGGLMKTMPWTANIMMAGAVAIAAIPPLNGFASKWLIYLGLVECGLLTRGAGSLPALFAVGALALVGSLAAMAFVRLTGTVFLGSPRTEAARTGHESSPWMLGPMIVLVGLCLIAGVMPHSVVALMRGVMEQLLGSEAGHAMQYLAAVDAPLSILGHLDAVILIAIATGTVVFMTWTGNAARVERPTWGCGYVRPTSRMQYGARSFAEMLTGQLLPRFLRPRIIRKAPRGLFPARGDFCSLYPDPFIERVYEPFFRTFADRCSRLRMLQQGKIHVYLVYIAVMVVLALAWVAVRTAWVRP